MEPRQQIVELVETVPGGFCDDWIYVMLKIYAFKLKM